MAKAPPLLPNEVLRRVLRLAQLDGMGLLVFAGGFALMSAYDHDVFGAVLGLIISGTGAAELHGAAMLRHGREKGVNWLIWSQLCLLAVVAGFCLWRLTHVDISFLEPIVAMLRPFITDDSRAMIDQLQLTRTEALTALYTVFFGMLGILTVAYQGGMAICYLRYRPRVRAALRELFGENQHS